MVRANPSLDRKPVSNSARTSNRSSFPQRGAIWVIAAIEALKGAVVLLAGSGLLSLVHQNLHELAIRLVEHTHLNPASRYPHIFVEALSNLHSNQLALLALGAAIYSALRFVEAYGLFRGRAWAEVLAAFSGAIYLPIEAAELLHHFTGLRVIILGINLVVVGVMVQALLLRRRSRYADTA